MYVGRQEQQVETLLQAGAQRKGNRAPPREVETCNAFVGDI